MAAASADQSAVAADVVRFFFSVAAADNVVAAAASSASSADNVVVAAAARPGNASVLATAGGCSVTGLVVAAAAGLAATACVATSPSKGAAVAALAWQLQFPRKSYLGTQVLQGVRGQDVLGWQVGLREEGLRGFQGLRGDTWWRRRSKRRRELRGRDGREGGGDFGVVGGEHPQGHGGDSGTPQSLGGKEQQEEEGATKAETDDAEEEGQEESAKEAAGEAAVELPPAEEMRPKEDTGRTAKAGAVRTSNDWLTKSSTSHNKFVVNNNATER